MDLEWVIYHLTMNDDEEFTNVQLDIDIIRHDDDQWERLLLGFTRNQTLNEIELVRGLQRMVANEDDIEQLFRSIRSIPTLSKVRLDSFSTDDLNHSTSLFMNNDKIEELVIDNMRKERNPRNHNRFDDTHLDFLVSMCQRRLRRLQIEIPGERSAPLRWERESSSFLNPVHAPFHRLLCGPTKLETLVIESETMHCSIIDEHCNAIMEALETNATLKYFDMDLRISPQELDRVSTMLERNRTLQDLRLYVHPSIREHPDISLRFLNAFKVNDTLEKFANYGMFGNIPKTTDLVTAEFDMLESNLSLESFAFFNEDTHSREKRSIYLRLNEKGRRLVHHNEREQVPKAVWINQLDKHKTDLDCLFYYLLSNPSLCSVCSDGGNIVIDTDEVISDEFKSATNQRIEERDDNPREAKRPRTDEDKKS
jgi:hypothetical protein